MDPLLPIAPARVKALLLPVGRIKADRFAPFVDRLQSEHVVHLRDITADGRPNRNMFSPLAYPNGAMLYDLITHVPPPSHIALSPFDLYREPLAVIALADGKELDGAAFSKRTSLGGPGTTPTERNIRALHQQLEELRDQYPRALVHRVLIFDYIAPDSGILPIPDDMFVIPPAEESLRTTIKTVMCDISSVLLGEMTTLAKSFEAMTSVESPTPATGRSPGTLSPDLDGSNGNSVMQRRNSHFAPPQANGRSDKSHARMSMPPVPSHSSSFSAFTSSKTSPTPGGDDGQSSGNSTPDTGSPRPDTPQTSAKDAVNNRVSVHGFGPGGVNEKWRLKGKGRISIIIGSMYLQAGRWADSLNELMEGATATRSLNDHIWHGKALELILMNLLLLGWSGLEFDVPQVCLPAQEGPKFTSWPKADSHPIVPDQPKHVRNLQVVLPELLERIINLYSRKRADSEKLPALPFAETTIRFCKILSALHLCGGDLNRQSLDMIVTGKLPTKELSTSPRLNVVPSRQQIVSLLFDVFPGHASSELLTTADRASILSGIAAVLNPLGLRRKRAMVMRELVSVLITGLVEARTRGAAEAGFHPAAGLVSLVPGTDPRSGVALDISANDVEQGLDAFLGLLCRSYGAVAAASDNKVSPDDRDSDEAIKARIYEQSAARLFGFTGIKLNVLRACINFSEALPDFNGVLQFSADLLRTAGAGVAPGTQREDITPTIHPEEEVRVTSNIARAWTLAHQLGLKHPGAEYWDEFLVRGVKLEPLPNTRAPVPHAHSALPGASAGRESQDVDPFIYNPFLKKPTESKQSFLVANEPAIFRVSLQNTYDMEIEIDSIRLEMTGVPFDATPETARLGPNRTQLLRLTGKAKEAGDCQVTGVIVKVRGCRERRFPIFSSPWRPVRDIKIKARGVKALEEGAEAVKRASPPLEMSTLGLTAIAPQPFLVLTSMTLPQSSVMVLEGERHIFSVTLRNQSPTPVDFMLFSFRDSTQAPLQAALNSRDSTAIEIHEYELILMKKQALRLPTAKSKQRRNIAPGAEETFDFQILGKPGLTEAAIQVDYTNLGVPRDEVTEQFYTRQLTIDLTVTVNASIELARADMLALTGPALESIVANRCSKLSAESSTDIDANDYCLLSLDLRNSWPAQITVHIEDDDGLAVEESILPGNTNRILMPIKRIFIENPHMTIPSLNPTQDSRQFVVSTHKITPEMERANREAFWYREKMLNSLKATWATTSSNPNRNGALELRSLPLCHRSLNVALDHTRKLAWNGTLQQVLPTLQGQQSGHFTIGMTPLCRGEFELTASVEEVHIHDDGDDDEKEKRGSRQQGQGQDQVGRQRSNTQTMVDDAALGVQGRRVWHSRQPFILAVMD
ncbi:trafficking protein particle complex subunit 9 [Geosmithia morbida]|uniref:Trafficking protein particle complex subunit 9 n=1 Tax=Geosmithia morbida TaxID=1094350 RepID=A0A9P4YS87_9HYPO|nr:trafficking protein particle complex subunit 9 [Geosmithia morbida]KAF4120778.1 trafficking protein particle complex subunit 9 [Geosmithia morbida]